MDKSRCTQYNLEGMKINKLLIVDDSRFVQQVLKKAIQERIQEIQILTASNGAEGLRLYEEEKPDYIISDLLMPEINGREMVARIREKDIDTQIIILTADVQKATREVIQAYGIMAFINKPITAEKIDCLVGLLREGKDA